MQILSAFSHRLILLAGPRQIQQFTLPSNADLGRRWLNQSPLLFNAHVQLFF
jgi:hypothetical protein